MSADPFDLSRFVSAQAGVFNVAIAELLGGRKRTHWMWFIFPQLRALGLSPTAQFYGLSGLDEASAYLEHALLGIRLHEALEAVNNSHAVSLRELFGAPDDQKFCSSMTLFSIAASGGPFSTALDRWCAGQADAKTLSIVAPPKPR